MTTFSLKQKIALARSFVHKISPAYVQFYITSRCNLTCEQCNIIYGDATANEMTISQIRDMAVNLAEIGVCIVLLIGGEPFIRKDIALIVKAFTDVGIHVRMQTNGIASRKQLEECIGAGGHDISISLDSLKPALQDKINGGFAKSWDRAIDTISMVSELFPSNGTAFFNSVLMPSNLYELEDVIKFGTAIGWGTSIVPVHTTTPDKPRAYRTIDDGGLVTFNPSDYEHVRSVVDDLKFLRKSGQYLYDSDEYLDDVYRFIAGLPLEWRRRNNGVCDSPNLYFAISPNGNIKVCCDYEIPSSYPIYSKEFPAWYKDGRIHEEVLPITKNCSGCMYGSYPEISVSQRFFKPMVERFKYFNVAQPKLERYSSKELKELASEILKISRNKKANRRVFMMEQLDA